MKLQPSPQRTDLEQAQLPLRPLSPARVPAADRGSVARFRALWRSCGLFRDAMMVAALGMVVLWSSRHAPAESPMPDPARNSATPHSPLDFPAKLLDRLLPESSDDRGAP